MKITFTGTQDRLNPSQERKLAAAFAKLSKLLERRGEKEAQVILSSERHLKKAEVKVNFYDNSMVGVGAATDQFTAMMDAVEKVEKQALKSRAKWREAKRGMPVREAIAAEEAPAPPRKFRKSGKPSKVVRAGGRREGKPMTIDEAMLALEDEQDYVVYRDSKTEKVSVLIKRRDGKVDLVEA